MKLPVLLITSLLVLSGCSSGSDSPKYNDGISIEGFSRNGSSFKSTVSYDTSTFSFSGKVIVPQDYTWALFADSSCTSQIVSKQIDCNYGNNYVYLSVCDKNNEYKYFDINVYRLSQYTVSFNTNGGSYIENQYVIEGELAIRPVQDPTRSGYKFVNWDYDFKQPVKSNLTINAIWEEIRYKVVLDPNGGTIDGQTKLFVGYGGYLELPEPTKFGYKFLGWYDNNGNQQKTGYFYLTNDLYLTASWEIGQYKIKLNELSTETKFYVTFDYNNVAGEKEIIEVKKGEALPYKELSWHYDEYHNRYTFLGWYTANGQLYRFCDPIYSSFTLKARWANGPFQFNGGQQKMSWYGDGAWPSYGWRFHPLYPSTIKFEIEADYEKNINFSLYKMTGENDYGECFLSHSKDFATKTLENGHTLYTLSIYLEPFNYGYSVYGYSCYMLMYNGFNGSNSKCYYITISADKPGTSTVTLADDIEPIVSATYNSNFDLGIPLSTNNKTFIGWFTEENGQGRKLTGSDGKSLSKYDYSGDISAYSYFI